MYPGQPQPYPQAPAYPAPPYQDAPAHPDFPIGQPQHFPGAAYPAASAPPAPPTDHDDPSQAQTALIEIFGPHEAFGPPPEEMPTPEHEVGSPMMQRFPRIRSHARRRRVPVWALFVLIVGIASVGAGLRFVPSSPFYPAPESPGALAAAMPFHFAEITPESLGTEGFLSWAYLDLRDGTIVGSTNMSEPTDTESMIKAWFGADYLRRAAEQGVTPPDSDLADIQATIQDGDLVAADRIVANVGGASESIGRMVTMCQLTDSRAVAEAWTRTVISARDAVRMGSCLADGRAAGAQWTPWIMDSMRQVRGEGDFGIGKAFPSGRQATIATTNGWALRDQDGMWHANCLAISETWVLAVMQRYPSNGDRITDLAHIDAVCKDVVRKLTS